MKLSRFFPLVLLFSAAAVAQQYPGAIVTDSQLGVAANNCGTTLAQFVNSTATTFTVSSASCIVANMWMTIDSEIVHVCSVNTGANTFQVGVASCPNVDGRAYDGSSAATHNSSAAVTSNIDAGNHNAVAAELKAIEAALGISLANITALIPNPTPVAKGGTNATTAAGARTNLGVAASGVNADITSLTNLSTPLPVGEGGSGATTASAARTNLGAAASGANTDITSLANLSTPLPIGEGGTGQTTQSAALAAILGTSTVPVANGGTGAASKPAMRTSFGFEAYTPDYNFTAQTPGGSLTSGIGNNVTLTPCPLGVKGSAASLPLYVSAGSGTPEAVTVTGGTCTGDGATNGTVIFTPANNHSGAWTIQSATGGVRETMIANPWGKIRLPCNSPFHTKATITIDSSGVGYEIFGCGRDPNAANSSLIINDDQTSSVNTFTVTGGGLIQQVYFHDFAATCNVARTCGTHIDVTGFGGLIVGRTYLVNSGVHGLHCNNCIGPSIFDNTITHNGRYGIFLEHATNAAKVDHNIVTDNSWSDGYGNIRLTGSAGFENLENLFTGNDVESCGGSPAHPGVSTCYNLAIDNSFGVHWLANYAEIAKPVSSLSLYCGANSRGLVIDGNRFQDGAATIDTGCIDWEIRSNRWANFSAITTGWTINTPTSGMIYGRQSTETGSGAITFNVVPFGTAAATAGAATLNAQSGTITSEALVTAAGSIYTLTLTDSTIAATSVLSATTQLGTATTGIPQIVSVAPGAGSVIIKVKNIDGAVAFNGTVKVQFTVSNIN